MVRYYTRIRTAKGSQNNFNWIALALSNQRYHLVDDYLTRLIKHFHRKAVVVFSLTNSLRHIFRDYPDIFRRQSIVKRQTQNAVGDVFG